MSDWHDEARALRAERLRLQSTAERAAFDNQCSASTGLPVGILLLALESETLDAADEELKETYAPH